MNHDQCMNECVDTVLEYQEFTESITARRSIVTWCACSPIGSRIDTRPPYKMTRRIRSGCSGWNGIEGEGKKNKKNPGIDMQDSTESWLHGQCLEAIGEDKLNNTRVTIICSRLHLTCDS